MDSVVVDSERTAKDCVAYLKQHKIPPMTFLPLQTIKVKAAHPRLRNLGGTARVAIDLVDYKPEFERAFMSACGYATSITSTCCIQPDKLYTACIYELYIWNCLSD